MRQGACCCAQVDSGRAIGSADLSWHEREAMACAGRTGLPLDERIK